MFDHWNYRVVRKLLPGDPKAFSYGIHEAYYNEDKVIAITEEPQTPHSDTYDPDPIQDLRVQLKQMLKAFDKPVINFEDIPEK
jgi:hypothetical protein